MHAQIRAEQARDSYVSGTESMEGNIRLVLRRRTHISMQNWIVGKELEVQEKVAGRGEAKGGKEGVLFVSLVCEWVIGAGEKTVPKLCDVQVTFAP